MNFVSVLNAQREKLLGDIHAWAGKGFVEATDWPERLLDAFTGEIMLGEVNVPYETMFEFFGGPDGDELTMMFDFELMRHTFMGETPGRYRWYAIMIRAGSDPANPQSWLSYDEISLDTPL